MNPVDMRAQKIPKRSNASTVRYIITYNITNMAVEQIIITVEYLESLSISTSMFLVR